ncbi:class I SAM-dependent methyltransferase [Massilia sp. Dwa41.01b]|uniref:class I SAM-dependent methyltransferase n=1 Tax=unclassified Massilia TaxID=2609279 RepID=UPI0016002228|nr:MULTISPECIES: class I SAM-dependent methyltransferase [unclassified Massilia]QNA88480.1 class I SAM-dependent methyltransferase [Massilia sp. Dwa41.01b]QNA99374.1 class I SAM-dependent methyltransferase [Massilia sp. Se16.2.3]
MSNQQVAQYYALLGEALEDKYLEPDMDEDIDDMSIHLASLLAGHKVLELGCGAGFWTEVVAEAAESVLAVDINANLVDIARSREMPEGKVGFRVADALDLPEDIGKFTAVLVSFLWSHLNKGEQEKLLATLKKRLGKDVLLVILDDSFVEGFSETIARTDAEGTTYQIVTAPEGERFELPKSYQSDSALRKRLGAAGKEIKIERVEFFWILTCRLK